MLRTTIITCRTGIAHESNKDRICRLHWVHHGVPSVLMNFPEVQAVLLEHLLEALQVTLEISASLLHIFGDFAIGNPAGVGMETLLANDLPGKHIRKHGSELPVLQLTDTREGLLDVVLGDGRQFG
jgi:hypothetical protein